MDQAMNWVDYVMLGLLALFLVYGFSRGFVRQILGITGILGGLYLATRYALELAGADFFKGMRERSPVLTEIAAYLAIFLLVTTASALLIALIWRFFPRGELRATDSFLGGVLGAIQGILVLGGISIGLINWESPSADPVKESLLAHKFARGCQALVSLIPEEGQRKIQEKFQESKRTVEEAFTKIPGEIKTHADQPREQK